MTVSVSEVLSAYVVYGVKYHHHRGRAIYQMVLIKIKYKMNDGSEKTERNHKHGMIETNSVEN